MARLSAGETLTLRVRRRGEVRDVALVGDRAAVPARPSVAWSDPAARTRIGAEVVRVERGSAGGSGRTRGRRRDHAHRRLSSTDAGAGHAVVRLLRQGQRVLVAVTRGDTHSRDDPGTMMSASEPAIRSAFSTRLSTASPTERSSRRRARMRRRSRAGGGCSGGRPRRRRWRSSCWPASRRPQGINLLSPATLSLLDPVVPVALAALGVLVGLGVGDRRTDDRRVFAAACLEAGVTMLVVSAGIAAVALAATSSIARPFWTLVLASGICAATSLTLPTGNPLEPRTTADSRDRARRPAADRGGRARCWRGSVRARPAAPSSWWRKRAASRWRWPPPPGCCLTRASSETEERVFAVSALLLVGGVADALSLSALFGGLVAGVFWRYAGRRPRDTISRDVLFVQHPLLVLVLLVAGARAELSLASLALGAGYLVLRVVGKLAGGAVGRRASSA